MDALQRKSVLRQQVKEKLSQLAPQEKKAQSEELCARLLALLPNDAAAVCAFIPLQDEPDIHPLLRELLRRGIPLFLPRSVSTAVTFHRAASLDDLRPGRLGIGE